VDETTILIVDDEPRVLDSLEAILAAEFRVLRAGHGEEALARLAAEPDVAVIVTDHRMPGMTGVELLRRSQEQWDAIRIVLTAYTDVDNLMDAINMGRIYHFIPKPWDPNELLVIVRRAAERWRLARENTRLRDDLDLAYNALRRETAAGREKPTSFEGLVGADTGLRPAVQLARKVLDGETTVLLLGETGTGKELFAHLIHVNGPRRARPFVAQSCGALPDSLLESELFGHTRGAFTGATGERKGLFEEADGGTIFLDEVGETSPAMQQRLLRVLQEGEIRRVGGAGSRRVDVRVVAATNADLEAFASGRRTSPPSPTTSCARPAGGRGEPCRGWGWRRSSSSAAIRGRATFASSRTRSSAPWPSRTTVTPSPRRISPSASRRPAPPPCPRCARSTRPSRRSSAG